MKKNPTQPNPPPLDEKESTMSLTPIPLSNPSHEMLEEPASPKKNPIGSLSSEEEASPLDAEMHPLEEESELGEAFQALAFGDPAFQPKPGQAEAFFQRLCQKDDNFRRFYESLPDTSPSRLPAPESRAAQTPSPAHAESLAAQVSPPAHAESPAALAFSTSVEEVQTSLALPPIHEAKPQDSRPDRRFWENVPSWSLTLAALAMVVVAVVFFQRWRGTSPRPEAPQTFAFKGAGPIEISAWYARPSPSGELPARRLLTPETQLHPDDLLQFECQTAAPLEVAILGIEAQGRVFAYVPLKAKQSFQLPPGKTSLPQGSLRLDESLGREWIIAVVAESPFSLDALQRELQSALQRQPPERVSLPSPWQIVWRLAIQKTRAIPPRRFER